MGERDQNPKIPIPAAGDAARKAREEGDAIDEAHGVRIVPRDEFRAAGSLRLRAVGGRGPRPAEEPKPDLTTRTAADYLPSKLKAQLIAEGRLTADGTLIANPPPRPPVVESGATGSTAPAPPPTGVFARLGRFFRKLF